MESQNSWCHLDEESIERFLLNHLGELELDSFEQHLLTCHVCQLRVQKTEEYLLVMRSALRDIEESALAKQNAISKERLLKNAFSRNVFISHGGPSLKHVEAIRDLVLAFDLKPIIARYMPNQGLSVTEKVRTCMRICRSAIVLATSDDESAATRSRTRANVDHEVGMLQTIRNIGNRIVYMKEPGVKFASNYSEKVWIDFHKERVQDAFVPLIKELKAFAF